MTKSSAICLIEDDEIMRTSLCQRFTIEGVYCDCFTDAAQALESIIESDYGLLISDIRLPGLSGEELYERLLESERAPPPIIFITGYGTVDQAVRLMHRGASDYITKPFDLDELLVKLEKIAPSVFGKERQEDTDLGVSVQMRQVMTTLQHLSGHRVDLLITGESGVGKEYAARYYARQLDNRGKPFVAVNCAALPEDLLEAELFGHEKGAFTGAAKTRRGLFEQADGGVLFLDEVGETSPKLQAKLLRCIQERCIQRIGGEALIPVDICLIYATNHDLQDLVRESRFREDLYYRINVAHVHIPPLRERPEDIIWLAHLVIDEFRRKYNQRKILLPITQKYLKSQSWPGNLRELANSVERTCILSGKEVLEPGAFDNTTFVEPEDAEDITNLRAVMENYEKHVLMETLELHQWRIAETAASLDISRKNLWEKMKKYDLNQPVDDID